MDTNETKTYFIVSIAYKSGLMFVGRFDEFSTKNGTYTWSCAANEKYPNMPMVLGVDNIESIWCRPEGKGDK